MSNDFEPFLAALLSHVQANVPSFKSAERRLIPWTQVDNQPALFLRMIAVEDIYDGSLLKRLISGELWVYAKPAPDRSIAPGTGLNALVGQVRDCFAPDDEDTGLFTLNRTVTWCRIEGRTLYAPGDTVDQSLAKLDVKILIP